MYDYKRSHPDAQAPEIYNNLVKYTVPTSLPGSPSWHRKNLNDLLCMVDKWGMPALFLTLTADEASNMHWSEIDDMHKMLHQFNADFTWKVKRIIGSTHAHAYGRTYHAMHILWLVCIWGARQHERMTDKRTYLLACSHRMPQLRTPTCSTSASPTS